MKPPFRSKQQVVIKAPLESVWAFNMDITKIPEFHPRVVKVELLSGKALREPGVSYKCYLSGGKHTCVEKDIVVESTLHRVGESSTRIEISHYYSTRTLKAKLLHLVGARRIARETQAMLNAMKDVIERRTR